mgnify:FL=1
MAKEVIIELKAKTDKIEKDVEGINKDIKTLNKNVDKTAEGFEGVEQATQDTAKGVKKIGATLKAIGIGLLLAAFAKLKEVFEQNQKVADTFNIAFESLSIAFNDFFRFLENNVGTITGFFKSIFDDPKQSLIDFANAFKRNIQERFESYLDTLGFLASAVKKVFSGDFAGALEDVKSAGKESLDVLTGVDNTFEKSVETVGKVTKAVKGYVESTVDAATENVELEKAARLADATLQGLLEEFDKRAEKQRQIRDDESISIAKRIEANTKLGEILDEQEEKMLDAAKKKLAAAQAEFDKNKENIDLQIALKDAQNDLAAVEAQITGFRSEQLTNTNSLLREQKDIQNELAEIGKNEFELAKIQRDQEEKEKRALIEREVTDEDKKQKLLLALNKHYRDLDLKADQEQQQAKQELIKGALSNIATIVGQSSKFGKAIAVVQAIQDTFAGANKAFSQAGIFGFIQGAAIIAAGLGNVKKIIATKTPKPPASLGARSTGGDTSVPVPATTSSLPPQFDTIGASGTNQLADLLGNQPPPRAFVVSGDVSTAQELDRNIVTSASLG